MNRSPKAGTGKVLYFHELLQSCLVLIHHFRKEKTTQKGSDHWKYRLNLHFQPYLHIKPVPSMTSRTTLAQIQPQPDDYTAGPA